MKVMSESVFNSIVDFIDEYYFTNNTVPTMQEIADAIKLNKSNVCRNLQVMKERGLIEITGGWRGIRTKKMMKVLADTVRVPIVGSIACGTPMLAEENIESYIPISSSILGAGKFFALHACGESMINANINDGDFVIVRQQNTAEEGQIIVALIEDEATLKRFYKDKNRHKIRLHPENDKMSDMYFDRVDIQGVVVKVIKDVV